jgi:hypothetical protein
MNGNTAVFDCPGCKRGSGPSVGIMFQGCYSGYLTDKMGIVQANWNDWNHAVPITAGKAWKDPNNSLYCADAYLNNQANPIQTRYPTVQDSTFWPSPQVYYMWSDRLAITGAWTRGFADYHMGTNCLILDGSVRAVKTRELDGTLATDPNCIWDVY